MGQFLYERPREKLLRAGVAALSNTELLQVVIGSGTSGASVRQLARRVNRLLLRHELRWSLEDLRSLKGIGLAKASLLVAAFELTSRLVDTHQGRTYSRQKDLMQLLAHIAIPRYSTAKVYMFDGASRLLGRADIRYEATSSGEYMATHILREAVKYAAVSIYVAFTQKGRNSTLTIEELSALRGVIGAGKLLALDIKGIATISEDGVVHHDKGSI